MFLQEASNETRLCKGSPVWPFIILKGTDSLYKFRLWAQRPPTEQPRQPQMSEGKVAAQQFTHIGKHTFIGGASLIRKNVPPYIKAAREPLTFAGVNSIGLRRRGFEEEAIREIEDLYRVLFIQNSNISKGIKAIAENMDKTETRDEILDFINSAEKGIIRGMI